MPSVACPDVLAHPPHKSRSSAAAAAAAAAARRLSGRRGAFVSQEKTGWGDEEEEEEQSKLLPQLPEPEAYQVRLDDGSSRDHVLFNFQKCCFRSPTSPRGARADGRVNAGSSMPHIVPESLVTSRVNQRHVVRTTMPPSTDTMAPYSLD